jgi:hypothetical protein
MARKKKPADLAKDLWINPHSNMRGPDGNRGRSNKGNITPSNGSRFLELADIALGKKEVHPRKKRGAA